MLNNTEKQKNHFYTENTTSPNYIHTASDKKNNSKYKYYKRVLNLNDFINQKNKFIFQIILTKKIDKNISKIKRYSFIQN